MSNGDITFHTSNTEMIRLDTNGDIYIRGKFTTNDIEAVEGMRDFLKETGHIKPDEYPNTLIVEPK